MDLRQGILLGISTLIPLLLLVSNRPHYLLGWICISFSVHILDTVWLVNLSAARIAGLLYVPYAIVGFRNWFSLRPAQWSLLYAIVLIILDVLFGVVCPWPDTIGRTFNLTSPGRAIVNSVRIIADLSLTVFISQELLRPGAFLFALRALIAGATLTALVGVIGFLTQTDYYFEITGFRDMHGLERSRGLSFEPRGLGLAGAYGIMAVLVYPFKSLRSRISLALCLWVGSMAAFSTSAFVLTVVGLLTLMAISPKPIKARAVSAAIVFGALVIWSKTMFPDTYDQASLEVNQRIDPSERLGSGVAWNWSERIAYRLDVFDASAYLFLSSNPEYLVFGVGPGMMMIPASDYLPPGVFSEMYGSNGLDGLPTHGPLLEISNGGIVGLVLWIIQVLSCWFALQALVAESKSRGSQEWQVAKIMFIIGVVFYIVQCSINTPIWTFFLGIGWAAFGIARSNPPLAPTSGSKTYLPSDSVDKNATTDDARVQRVGGGHGGPQLQDLPSGLPILSD